MYSNYTRFAKCKWELTVTSYYTYNINAVLVLIHYFIYRIIVYVANALRRSHDPASVRPSTGAQPTSSNYCMTSTSTSNFIVQPGKLCWAVDLRPKQLQKLIDLTTRRNGFSNCFTPSYFNSIFRCRFKALVSLHADRRVVLMTVIASPFSSVNNLLAAMKAMKRIMLCIIHGNWWSHCSHRIDAVAYCHRQ